LAKNAVFNDNGLIWYGWRWCSIIMKYTISLTPPKTTPHLVDTLHNNTSRMSQWQKFATRGGKMYRDEGYVSMSDNFGRWEIITGWLEKKYSPSFIRKVSKIFGLHYFEILAQSTIWRRRKIFMSLHHVHRSGVFGWNTLDCMILRYYRRQKRCSVFFNIIFKRC